MVGLANPKYGWLVIHPPPIVVLNFPLVLLSIIPRMPDFILINASYGFNIMMFWLENIVWLILFLTYETMLTPIVYFKNIFVVAINSFGVGRKIANTLAWMFGGPFYIIFFIFRDMYYLLRIFADLPGCRAARGL